MASSFNINDSSVSNLFKRQYREKSLNTYNGKVPFLGRVEKSYDLVGSQREMEVPTGFQGGAGSGSLPSPNRGVYVKPIITPTKQYCVTEVDRMTIKLAKDEGAFVDALKESTKKTVEKFNWNISRQCWNTLANGSLGTIDSVTDNTGGSYTLVITAATWKLANFEIRDFVNIESGNTDKFEITAVTKSSTSITVQRITGSQVPVAADVIYLQGSQGNDIQSFALAAEATTSTLYSVTVGYRWQAYQPSTGPSGAGITSDWLNDGMLGVEEQSGVTPSAIYTSYTQLRKILNSMEDQKYYSVGTKVEPRASNLKGVVSFPAVEFASTQGPVPILVDRFIETDSVYFVSEDNTQLLHAPDMGWHDDEGFVFLRMDDSDGYTARYGAYMQSYFPPSVHGATTGFSTT